MDLHAGPLTVTYDSGTVRLFRIEDEEVLRMIYAGLRDADWNTASLVRTNESITDHGDSFQIRYDWQSIHSPIAMTGHLTIEGTVDGSLTVDFHGQAQADFYRNRIGLCMLHPVEGLAGQPVWIEHPDGNTSEAVFPSLISPTTPFLNIRGMRWQMASGQPFRLTYEGDVFETEDQRNWTDASYKTYSTPSALPIPAFVPAGTIVTQRVRFERLPQNLTGPITPSTASYALPRLGLGARADGVPLTANEADRLKACAIAHLRADVFFTNPDWTTGLMRASRDARLLGVPLELALFFTDTPAADAEALAAFVQAEQPAIWAMALFEASHWRTTAALLDAVLTHLRTAFPKVLLGAGTDANFVEINQHRLSYDRVDFVTYSVNPQAHLTDSRTMLENTAAQADTVATARVFSGGKPIHISPITLNPRFNPVAQDAAATLAGHPVPRVDPRHHTTFCAEWTARSLATLTRAGAASVTYFETHGPRGLLDETTDFPVLQLFRQPASAFNYPL